MNQIIEYQNVHENRQYKSDLFCTAFSEKKYKLGLYNAVNGTSYTNPDELEVNTLENVLYMGMKNDISFLVGCTMNLYEHQSTVNPNMPLRGLLYFAKLYERYVAENGLNIYSSKLKKLPTPRYLVFYNGTEEEPDERILRLSEAFVKEGGCLECEVRLLNINHERNKELMEKCRRLEEYALFIARVRDFMADGKMPLKEAITRTIEVCLKEGILPDILCKERTEVLGMVLSTFNKELYEKELKEDAFRAGEEKGRREGREEGREEGKQEGACEKLQELVQKKLAKGKSIEEIAEDLEESVETILELM